MYHEHGYASPGADHVNGPDKHPIRGGEALDMRVASQTHNSDDVDSESIQRRSDEVDGVEP